jgi:hypothetical protein
VFEHARRGLGLGETLAVQAVLVEHNELARFDVADELGA